MAQAGGRLEGGNPLSVPVCGDVGLDIPRGFKDRDKVGWGTAWGRLVQGEGDLCASTTSNFSD